MFFDYLYFLGPWVIVLVGYPFYTLATATGNRTLRFVTLALMVGVAPVLFISQIVFIAIVGTGD